MCIIFTSLNYGAKYYSYIYELSSLLLDGVSLEMLIVICGTDSFYAPHSLAAISDIKNQIDASPVVLFKTIWIKKRKQATSCTARRREGKKGERRARRVRPLG